MTGWKKGSRTTKTLPGGGGKDGNVNRIAPAVRLRNEVEVGKRKSKKSVSHEMQ